MYIVRCRCLRMRVCLCVCVISGVHVRYVNAADKMCAHTRWWRYSSATRTIRVRRRGGRLLYRITSTRTHCMDTVQHLVLRRGRSDLAACDRSDQRGTAAGTILGQHQIEADLRLDEHAYSLHHQRVEFRMETVHGAIDADLRKAIVEGRAF